MSDAAPDALVIRGASTCEGTSIDIHCDGDVIGAARAGDATIDATGLTAVPGFVDLQVNGAAGIDLVDAPERVWEVAAALPAHGVTRFLPTLVSCDPGIVARALATLAAGPPPGWRGAVPSGLHLEGPVLAHARAGAHDPALLVPPSAVSAAGWSRAAGVAMVTLAPELPGALDLIAELRARGVAVAIGHTDATAEDLRAAWQSGAQVVTHLFNAMAPFHHRRPGPAGAVLGGIPLAATLIVDGAHLHPDAVRIAWRLLGAQRRILVSDATAALGAPPGRYRLGGRTIESDGMHVRDGSGRLAGACRGLDHAVRTVIAITGCAPSEAFAAASGTPARLLGWTNRDSLEPGSAADVVLLDRRLGVAATVVRGRLAYRRAES